MSNHVSPLQVIHQKELELKRRIEAAQERMESRLQAAREAAARTIAQAEQTGKSEAEALYKQGLESARREAEAILAAAQAEAGELRRRARLRLEEAARHIVELILPAVLDQQPPAVEITNNNE